MHVFTFHITDITWTWIKCSANYIRMISKAKVHLKLVAFKHTCNRVLERYWLALTNANAVGLKKCAKQLGSMLLLLLRWMEGACKNDSQDPQTISTGDCAPPNLLHVYFRLLYIFNRWDRDINWMCSLVCQHSWIHAQMGYAHRASVVLFINTCVMKERSWETTQIHWRDPAYLRGKWEFIGVAQKAARKASN